MTPRFLHLMRHGAPEQAGRFMGHSDGTPTAEGIATCVARAEGLAVDVVVTSDLTRARQAGGAIAEPLAKPHIVDPRWRELDFGDWDGLAPADLDQAALGRFWADPDAHPPPGGERWSDLVARVTAALDGIDAESALVVTHGGAMRAVLHQLCGFDQRQVWAFDLPYAVLLSLRVWPGERPNAQIVGLAA